MKNARLHITRSLRAPVLASIAILSACREAPNNNTSAEGLQVVATTAMIADPARVIAGPHAQVTALMGEGVDPHLYKPTRNDMATLLAADLILYNGLHLEGRMTDALERVAADGTPTHAVTERLDPALLRAEDANADQADPHVWMDPLAWLETTRVTADALAAIAPDHAETFQTNATAYQEQLRSLDAYARESIATIPEGQRVLVTAHDAFHYFAARYDIQVHAIQGLSTESEAGVRDIENLVDLLVARNIRAVFIESSVSDRNIKALIAGAAARGHSVDLGGTLFSDATGPAGTYEGTYIGMLDHNITTIVRALGGTAPPRGMSGQLAEPTTP